MVTKLNKPSVHTGTLTNQLGQHGENNEETPAKKPKPEDQKQCGANMGFTCVLGQTPTPPPPRNPQLTLMVKNGEQPTWGPAAPRKNLGLCEQTFFFLSDVLILKMLTFEWRIQI